MTDSELISLEYVHPIIPLEKRNSYLWGQRGLTFLSTCFLTKLLVRSYL